MKAKTIQKNLSYVGAFDPERTLFDSVMPLTRGTSYNSYLLQGERKTALLELVKDDEKSFNQLITKIKSVLPKERMKIDYLILHHSEPDHVLVDYFEKFYKIFPDITIVGSPQVLVHFEEIHNRKDIPTIKITNNLVLHLGGYTLKFLVAPLLHWPDTAFSYCPELGALFCCDVFGVHYYCKDVFRDTIVDKNDLDALMQERKSYFDIIFGAFKENVRSFLKRVKELEKLKMICSSHGPVMRGSFVKEVLKIWTEWSQPTLREDKVILAYVSAHGFTKEMAKEVKNGIESVDKGRIKVVYLDLVDPESINKVISELTTAKGLIFGTPTIMSDAHPYVWKIVSSMNPLIHGNGQLLGGVFGSYGWSGEACSNITQRFIQLRLKVFKPLQIRFRASKQQKMLLRQWGFNFGKVIVGKSTINSQFEMGLKKNKLKFNKLIRVEQNFQKTNNNNNNSTINKNEKNTNKQTNNNSEEQTNQIENDGRLRLWKCLICGETVESVLPPDFVCGGCGASAEVFVCIGFAKSKDVYENLDEQEVISANYKGHIIVIGASAGGVSAVKKIREMNKKVKVTLISGENHMPYYRPHLTKVLEKYETVNDPRFQLLTEKWITENSLTFMKNAVVTGINRKKKTIQVRPRIKETSNDKYTLSSAKKLNLQYTKLILATGANQKLPREKTYLIPKMLSKKKKKTLVDNTLNEGTSSKKNVFGLRTLDDVDEINTYIKLNDCKSATILGCGPLGLETADSLRKSGIKRIYAIDSNKVIASSRLDSVGSQVVEKIVKKKGIRLFLGYQLIKILGDNSKVSKRTKKKKSKLNVDNVKQTTKDLAKGIAIQSIRLEEKELVFIESDIIIFALGVVSETSLAKKANLETKKGIVVNNKMQTSDPNIFACGDCIEYNFYNDRSWQHAIETGEVAARFALNRNHPSTYIRMVPPYSIIAFGIHIFSTGKISNEKLESVMLKSDNGMEYLRLFFEYEENEAIISGGIYIGNNINVIVDIKKFIISREPFKRTIKRLVNYYYQLRQNEKMKFSFDNESQNYENLLSGNSILNQSNVNNNSSTNLTTDTETDSQLILVDLFPNIKSLIISSKGIQAFKQFLEAEYSEENIEFWNEVEQFQLLKDGHENQQKIAMEIYEKYVAYESPKQINIDHFTRVKITEKIKQNKLSGSMFKKAQTEIENLLQRDSFPRFMVSEKAEKLVQEKKKLKEVLNEEELKQID
ncbi:diflavin flavoprotein a 2-related [Anaeramoeba flamelloides]|uniref:Diflavin flavoprotein a 2-related n=1 Tax=Anaeramoeba flamelloides TaxID=1746091 RepID=A0AAV7YJT4_9EUKA|nr:diflavin flavoprotein a 2-related [Anaeramoeba flamelloides]